MTTIAVNSLPRCAPTPLDSPTFRPLVSTSDEEDPRTSEILGRKLAIRIIHLKYTFPHRSSSVVKNKTSGRNPASAFAGRLPAGTQPLAGGLADQDRPWNEACEVPSERDFPPTAFTWPLSIWLVRTEDTFDFGGRSLLVAEFSLTGPNAASHALVKPAFYRQFRFVLYSFPYWRRIPCRWESGQVKRNIWVIFQQFA